MTPKTPKGQRAPFRAASSIRRHLIIAVSLSALLVGGVGGWAATTEIAGAVVAQGRLVVESYVKEVKHQDGGVVGEILVKNGTAVRAGDVLLRLDATQTGANLSIIAKRLDELRAREARLAAERDGSEAIAFPEDLMGRSKMPDVAGILAGERKLFETRRASLASQRSQLRQRIEQLGKQIEGLQVQIVAKDEATRLIENELTGLHQLLKQGLTQLGRVASLEREAAGLTGERGALVASIAEAKGKIVETELQILGLDQGMAEKVAQEIREVQGQIGEFVEREIAAKDKLSRIEIRAPQDGVVQALAVHSAGAVISAGQPILNVVPVSDNLTIEARIAPQDIDQLIVGQPAYLRFSAFNQRTTPEVNGTVTWVSADLTEDPQRQFSYYLVRITPDVWSFVRLGDQLKPMPGMPVEAFIRTGERSALSYLVKPLSDQIARAFREE